MGNHLPRIGVEGKLSALGDTSHMDLLTGQKEHCHQEANNCRRLAIDPATSHQARQQHLDMELRWLQLARHFELAERVSGYLEFSAGRRDSSVDRMSLPIVDGRP